MRSRDGDNHIWFSICTLISLIWLPVFASEFIISYRLVVADAKILNEHLDISESMTPCVGHRGHYIDFEISETKNLRKIIAENRDEFIDFLQKNDLKVSHSSININLKNRSQTLLQMAPQCFTVDFNDDFVRIFTLNRE